MVKDKNAAPASRGNEDRPAKQRSNGAILVISAMDMSWRLAIVVLAPIIGGYELDKHFNITPVLTIIGFLLAMAGLFYILRRTLAVADEKLKMRTQR